MMNNHKDFCIFILTHGRPSQVFTKRTLDKCNYTGDWYLVIDDEDALIDEYRAAFGEDKVLLFSKDAIAETFDEGDNFEDRRCIVYARNACWGLAKSLGYTYFMQLDDDYTRFQYVFDSDAFYTHKIIRNLDPILDIMIDWYKTTPFASIAMSQGGDLLGGQGSNMLATLRTKRKAMNTFICSVNRPFKFVGRLNEDVNIYTSLQRRGVPFITIFNVSINQNQTQGTAGGMTDIYASSGTYVKSFYTVMYAPSCCRVMPMHSTFPRLHHRVDYNACAPAILHEKHRKAENREPLESQ